MAAGLGFKDFVTGEVLTAADVDGYLMQGVWVFASAAARDAAVTSPQEGNFAYLKDTNVTTYYTGSAWANLDTTGMTNPMTTTGDTIYSSSGSTPARLGIGSTGNVLTVAGGVPTWAAPAGGGGMTLLSTTTLSAVSTTITIDPTGYTDLAIRCTDLDTANDASLLTRLNGDSGSNYINLLGYKQGNAGTPGFDASFSGGTYIPNSGLQVGNNSKSNFTVTILNCNDTSNIMYNYSAIARNTVPNYYGYWGTGRYAASAAITSFTISNLNSESMTGTVRIYGVK